MDYCVKYHDCADSDTKLLIKVLIFFLLVLCSVLSCVDIFAVIEITNDADNYTEAEFSQSGLCGVLILGNHLFLTVIYFFRAISLFYILDTKLFRFIRCRQWYLTFTPFLCIESLNIFLFTIFGTSAPYFVAVANIGLTFKLYMLWPLKRYVNSMRNCSNPSVIIRKD